MEKKVQYTIIHRCEWCGRALALACGGPRLNPKRRYCSNKCRVAAYRARKRARQDAAR